MIADWRCRRLAPRLVDLAAGDLPPRYRLRVERHVAGCAQCREALSAMRAAPEALRAVASADEPQVDWERHRRDIMRAIRTLPEPRIDRLRAFEWRLALPVAAALLIAFAGLRMFWGTRSVPRSAAPSAASSPVLNDLAELVLPDDDLLQLDSMPEQTARELVADGWADPGDVAPDRDLDDLSDDEIEELADFVG
jgi:hypothetical protein